MKKIVFLLLSLLLTACKNDDVDDKPYEIAIAEIQKIVTTYQQDFSAKMDNKPIGIGLYVLEGDKGFYVSEGFPESYKENIQFRIASNSKTFTAAAILKLHQEGKLDINHKITDVIPTTQKTYIPATENFNIPYKNQITIKTLLQHRAGVFDVTNSPIPENLQVPYAGNYYIDYIKEINGEDYTFSFEELIGVVAETQLSDFEPGAAFHYSNTGYNILGYIVENVSGKRLHEYLQDEFFIPLNLENTYSPHLGSDMQMPSPYTFSYLNYEGEIIEIDKDNLTGNISEGQIISTPKSLAKWGKALLGSTKVLTPEVQAMMLDVLPADESHGFYGLGIQAYPTELGYGHDGAHMAYLSTMRYEPNSDRTFVIFTNHLNVETTETFINEATALYDILIETMRILDEKK
ncbi:D-alanyl-D-alanine carboxypeptidase [Mesonia hippocampi]|uniref:D-alanyl-D-alanine carboxypeptidase n=1 Tax=Mesonia hippocampi TaxID=1628250 RepID=A0A840ELC3_9FLAO|nr:serine hydrolase domain-containing protein [Mesonia hippocampi]MBB4117925.1 D-alanyl-D-alanine carboxypeptidase [Mesonia hippocampi]